MEIRRFSVGCRCAQYLFQLARGLLACRSLNPIDPGVARACFRIDRELDFSHR